MKIQANKAKDSSANNAPVAAGGQARGKGKAFRADGQDVMVWSAGSDRLFSIGGGERATTGRASGLLHFKSGSFDPQAILLSGGTLEATPPRPKDSTLFVVQFETQALEGYRLALEHLGAKVAQYMPDNAYLVQVSPKKVVDIASLPFVRTVVGMQPAWKLDAPVAQMLAAGAKDAGESTQEYNVVAVSRAHKATLVEAVRELGANVRNAETGTSLLVADLSAQQVEQLAKNDNVLWIQRGSGPENDMDNARAQGGANFLARVPGAFTGKGIRGHVLEGIDPNHPDFAPTAVRQKPIAVDNGASDPHGHATFGQIFGSGARNPAAKGLLPDAQGYYTDYDAIYSATPGSRAAGSRYDLTRRLINEHKVMFQTASWGYARTTQYDARSLEMDEIIFDHDIPITQSQSNSGARDSRPQAWAKNIISVGGLKHFDNTDQADDRWDGGGSVGPATDGRIKPDIAAYYDSILTTDLGNGYRTDFGGTSGATPIVAGHVGLLLQMWTDGIFGNPLSHPKEDRFANRPHFTTVKALLLASARQWEFAGTTHDRRRVHQGWGFPDLKYLYEMRNKMFVVNELDVLKNTQSKTYELTVAAGEPLLKATLVYADPPGNVAASKNRVNDVDLKVTAPDGTVYWGNNGLVQGMFSQAGGSPNDLDTVESVIIREPQAGKWKVEVIAREVNADGHKETGETDVDFALAVLGAKS